MPPLVRVEGADAHEAVYAALGLRIAVRVLTFDQDRRFADARLIASLYFLQLHLETATLRPAVVHAKEHVRPVIRLRSAGPRLDREDRVVPIELAGKKRGDFELVELRHH